MSEEKDPPNKFLTETGITVISGFVFSIFLIFIAFQVMVRFWVFDEAPIYEYLAKMIFWITFLLTGIIFNMSAVNLTLYDYCESSHILPFVIGTPIIFIWTVVCAIAPLYKSNIFSKLGDVPVVTYMSGFYDGSNYNPDDKNVHEFVKPYSTLNSLFGHTSVLVVFIIIFASK